MVSDFIYKYYIDPITQGQSYNIVDTLTYAIILVAAVYLLYRWLSTSTWLSDSGIKIDQTFVLATIPYIILGGVLRVIEDTGMITGNWKFLLITPLIYFTLFFFVLAMIGHLPLARDLRASRNSLPRSMQVPEFLPSSSPALSLLPGAPRTMGSTSSSSASSRSWRSCATTIVWAFMRYVLKWTYVADPLYITLLFGQLLDASATSYGIDLHPSVQYVEQHVVGSALIDATGTAFVMFPLKLIVLFPAIYVMEMYRKEANPAFWHLVLLAMIVVGFAPGIRDMVRMVLYV